MGGPKVAQADPVLMHQGQARVSVKRSQDLVPLRQPHSTSISRHTSAGMAAGGAGMPAGPPSSAAPATLEGESAGLVIQTPAALLAAQAAGVVCTSASNCTTSTSRVSRCPTPADAGHDHACTGTGRCSRGRRAAELRNELHRQQHPHRRRGKGRVGVRPLPMPTCAAPARGRARNQGTYWRRGGTMELSTPVDSASDGRRHRAARQPRWCGEECAPRKRRFASRDRPPPPAWLR